MSRKFQYPKLIVAYVIGQWKKSGDCWNVPRPTILGVRDQKVLATEMKKNLNSPMGQIREEFQQASRELFRQIPPVRKPIWLVIIDVLPQASP